jgi:methylglutaconyl-CoA hydratase
MGQYTKLTIENGVARLLLDRADKRNALKRETLEEITAAVAAVEGDSSVRVFVLEAAGAAFCAGMDVGEMQSRAESANGRSEWVRDSQVYREALQAVFNLPVPTVAAVSGAAVAGGVGLVLACDLVVASRSAFFFLPEPMRGITAAMVTPLLIHRVGPGAAGQLLLSGERWTAETAYTRGLCLDVAEDSQLAPRIEALIKAIFAGSREALAITKRHLVNMSGVSMDEVLEQSMQISAAARETGDAREGLAAFLEKRKPNWQPEN